MREARVCEMREVWELAWSVLYSSPVVLARYILKEHVAPFCYALFVITFLFLVDFLIRILSSILSKGLEWRVVLEIIILNLAWMLALSIPMAVLVATLMAYGRLSADNEITGLRALGVAPLRTLTPVLLVAAFLCVGLFWFNDKVLPESNYRAAALRNDIGRKKPTALISERRLIRDFDGYQIWINHLDDKTGMLYGVRIYQPDPGKPLRYTYADSASMEYVDGGKNLLIYLRHGENHAVDSRNPNSYARIRFLSQTVTLPNVDDALRHEDRTYRTDREMPVHDMEEIVKGSRERLSQLNAEYVARIFDDVRVLDLRFSADTGKSVPPRLRTTPWTRLIDITPAAIADARRQEGEKLYQIDRYEARARNEYIEINQYMVEIEKKFSIPVACLVFVLIGAPLGVMARRGGIGTGVLYSICFFLLYWVGLIRGEALADRLIISPWEAMWGPDILVGAAGLWLVWRMAREKYLPDRRPWQWLRLFRRRKPETLKT